jgi:hypothetical protein
VSPNPVWGSQDGQEARLRGPPPPDGIAAHCAKRPGAAGESSTTSGHDLRANVPARPAVKINLLTKELGRDLHTPWGETALAGAKLHFKLAGAKLYFKLAGAKPRFKLAGAKPHFRLAGAKPHF